MKRLVTKETNAIAGRYYVVTFKCDVLPNIVADILQALKGLMSIALEYVQGKHYEITSVEYIESKDKIEVSFYVKENPVQIGVIILAIVIVLGIFGTFLVFDKVEEIVEESPEAFASVGIGFLILILIGFFYFGRKLI